MEVTTSRMATSEFKSPLVKVLSGSHTTMSGALSSMRYFTWARSSAVDRSRNPSSSVSMVWNRRFFPSEFKYFWSIMSSPRSILERSLVIRRLLFSVWMNNHFFPFMCVSIPSHGIPVLALTAN